MYERLTFQSAMLESQMKGDECKTPFDSSRKKSSFMESEKANQSRMQALARVCGDN
jgi:hypothetical protein